MSNPKVDKYFAKPKQWRDEQARLREIVSSCEGLFEDYKWMHPCYTLGEGGGNVVLIHAFKEYCALAFFKGALMKDVGGILVQQTENVQAGRQLRFASMEEIDELEDVIKAYVREAIAIEKAGLKIEYKKTSEFAVPDELRDILDDDDEFRAAFEALTPGRQRGYLLHFGQPKKSETRVARIEKLRPKIMAGKGLND